MAVTTGKNSAGPLYVGVDVGGTNIKLGVVDDSGRTLIKESIPTEVEKGPTDAMQRVSQVMGQMISQVNARKDDIVAVGLATPGTMDIPAGKLVQPHNLPGWWGFAIRDCLRDACGKPVSFVNDANAAALGEFWVGSGSEFHSIVLFTLGTGVGGGIIIGDLSIEGENSAGSELGHTIIDYNDGARMCGCGQPGHLEAYASAKAVVQRTIEALDSGRESSLKKRRESESELTPLVVAQEAETGDSLAIELVMDTARFLGIGTVTVMHTVDPGAVIFGGAMDFGGRETDLGQKFLHRIRQEVRDRAFPVLAEKTHIDFASLGGDAGYIGAAAHARVMHRKTRD